MKTNKLPNGWIEVPLEKLVDILDSQRIPINSGEREFRISNKPTEALVPYYGAAGQVGYVDDFIFDESLVLLGEDGISFLDKERNKSYIIEGKSWVNNHAHVLRPRSDFINERYLMHYLNYFDYSGYTTGSTRLKLTQESMKTIPIRLPILAIQNKLTEKIDKVRNRVISSLIIYENLLNTIHQLKQSLLTTAVTGGLTEQWRDDNRKQNEWNKLTIGEALLSSQYGTNKKCTYDSSGTPVLRIPNISENNISLDDVKYAHFDKNEFEKLLLEAGDILIIRSNGSLSLVGKAAIVNEREAGYLYAGYLVRLKVNKSIIRPEYLVYYLNSSLGRKKIESTVRSTNGVNNINPEQIKLFDIHIPSLSEQDIIIQHTNELLNNILALEARALEVGKIFKKIIPALYKKAFDGNLLKVKTKINTNNFYQSIDSFKPVNIALKKKIIKRNVDKEMTSIEDVLKQAEDWLLTEEIFFRSGIGAGADPSEIEQAYAELRQLSKSGKLDIKPVIKKGLKWDDLIKYKN